MSVILLHTYYGKNIQGENNQIKSPLSFKILTHLFRLYEGKYLGLLSVNEGWYSFTNVYQEGNTA